MTFPAIRTQTDEKQMEFSLASGLDCSGEPDLARQEFKQEADTNYLLQRFGMNVPVQHAPTFGEVDFDLDLHSAHIAIGQVQQAWHQLSPELRAKYRTTNAMLDAMNSGELRTDLEEARDAVRAEKAKAEASSAPASTSNQPTT